ncbi:putative pentatricopeptide repeat-containing protein [Trifolium repens]|nr:putative pentatricopeptide repeat-containing protein [Trifolium repens]
MLLHSVAYAVGIRAHLRSGKTLEANTLFDQMKDNGLEPNVQTFNMMLFSLLSVKVLDALSHAESVKETYKHCTEVDVECNLVLDSSSSEDMSDVVVFIQFLYHKTRQSTHKLILRNCYKINVTSGTKYLIKAYFYYGNYDNLNQPPQFDLLLGANVWDTLKFPNASILRPRLE